MHQSSPFLAPRPRTDSALPETKAVLACAMRLRHLAPPGLQPAPLRGRNVGLLCAGGTAPGVQVFHDAAAQLGATVAIIASDLSSPGDIQRIHHTAGLLSRLYDGVACHGLPDEVVERLARSATIPVTGRHIAAVEQADVLAALLDGTEEPERKRRLVLQALVMHSMCWPQDPAGATVRA